MTDPDILKRLDALFGPCLCDSGGRCIRYVYGPRIEKILVACKNCFSLVIEAQNMLTGYIIGGMIVQNSHTGNVLDALEQIEEGLRPIGAPEEKPHG